MDNDDCKTWMLKRGECEELHCPHLLKLAATQEEPAERECTCKSVCPHDEPARIHFAVVRVEVMEEAITESWEELLGPLETLLSSPMHGPALGEAVLALRRRANDLIDDHTTKVLEHRHEL